MEIKNGAGNEADIGAGDWTGTGKGLEMGLRIRSGNGAVNGA